jgi:hypothetical protein
MECKGHAVDGRSMNKSLAIGSWVSSVAVDGRPMNMPLDHRFLYLSTTRALVARAEEGAKHRPRAVKTFMMHTRFSLGVVGLGGG